MADFIVAFIVGILAGIGLMILYIAYKFKSILNELDTYIDRAIDSTLLGITVEKHDNLYRFYRAQDNQFICQTATLEGIQSVFKEQFPTRTVYIEGGDEEAVKEIKKILVKGEQWRGYGILALALAQHLIHYIGSTVRKLAVRLQENGPALTSAVTTLGFCF